MELQSQNLGAIARAQSLRIQKKKEEKQEKQKDEAMETFPGEHCRAAGMTLQRIMEADPLELEITNGIAFEIYQRGICVKGKRSGMQSIMFLCGFNYDQQNDSKVVNRVRMMIKRIELRRKNRRKDVEIFLNQVFKHYKDNFDKCYPQSSPSSSSSSESPSVESAGLSDDQKVPDENACQCCLLENGERCMNPAGKNKCRLNGESLQSLGLQTDDTVSHSYICTSHNTRIRSSQRKRKRPTKAEDPEEEVNFNQFERKTLNLYKKHFKIVHRSGFDNKQQLAEVVKSHFYQIPVNEPETILKFLDMAKRSRSNT